MDNIEISLGKFRLEIFLVYISSGGQRWGGVGAKLGQSYCPQRMNSLLSGSERANDPALWEAEGHDDEDKVEDHLAIIAVGAVTDVLKLDNIGMVVLAQMPQ